MIVFSESMVLHSQQRKNLMTILPLLKKQLSVIIVLLANSRVSFLTIFFPQVAVSGTPTVLRFTTSLLK
jgi:hypothetical protein